MKTITRILGFVLISLCAGLHAADRPNIVWLTSEDNSVHYLDLYWKGGASTPNIAKLAEHGLVFNHAFSNAPVCSVARTTLLTGAYGPRLGTHFHRRSKMVPMPEGARMYPWYLRQAGYYTTNNSKTDYNAIVSDGWDESSTKATWRNRKPGQPFFHVQNTTITHESSLHFTAEEIATVKNDTPSDSVELFPYFPDTPTFRYTHARYLDNQVKMDAYHGDYIRMLEEDGLMDDTFIFYYGDHGGVLPRGKGYLYESGLHVPFVVYVPKNWTHLVDAKLGTRVDGFVSFVDFAATLLNLAGVDIPPHMDGKPFLGKGVSMAEVNRRDEAFGYADRMDEKYDPVRTLRKGKYKYMRSYQPFNYDGLWNQYRYRMLAYQEWWELFKAGKLNAAQRQFFEPRPAEQLFDVEADPHEVHNLAGDPAYAPVLKDMRQRLSNKVKSINDLSMFPESFLYDEAFDNPVEFGRKNSARIAQLVDVADLSLLKFNKARKGITAALNSKDPWARYWGLIVCSCFGEQAKPFIRKARTMAAKDPENLVRVRAAEFLGLLREEDPAPVIHEVLTKANNEVETWIVLNTVVLLQDLKGWHFEIDPDIFPVKWLDEGRSNINRRLDYLTLGYDPTR
ncbi:MAG: sulfatase-like hydrolase/transferase [Verrucomicrobiae bacterium]|nr:sulfatase-like hydrolase/transferase [Verrucomicrobiae bacterium]